jgi:hypothetical protein
VFFSDAGMINMSGTQPLSIFSYEPALKNFCFFCVWFNILLREDRFSVGHRRGVQIGRRLG